jgi:hypothetical protein
MSEQTVDGTYFEPEAARKHHGLRNWLIVVVVALVAAVAVRAYVFESCFFT